MRTFSNSIINNLGERLRSTAIGEHENNDLEILQEYRTSHKEDMASLFNKLCSYSKSIDGNAIVTYRLKRIDSIITKLVRMPKTKLKRVGDIAGCRVIFSCEEAIYKLLSKLEEDNLIEVRNINDWVNKPQNDGYRSLHLYITLTGSSKKIEIQIRNQVMHNWATLVEISDLLYDAGLKEYKEKAKSSKLWQLHFLLSKSIENLTNSEKHKIYKIVKNSNYILELYRVFSRNYIQIRKRWIYIKNSPRQKYFLIEASKYKVPTIDSFEKFKEAEDEYFSRYQNKRDSKSNLVLTHLTKPSYKPISVAYSNYILTYHSFINQFYELLAELIIESLKAKKYGLFFSYFSFYSKIAAEEFITISNQLRIINSKNQIIFEKNRFQFIQKKTQRNNRLFKKKSEWLNDINSQVNLRLTESKNINAVIGEFSPRNSFFRIYYKQRINLISKLSNSKVRGSIRRLNNPEEF